MDPAVIYGSTRARICKPIWDLAAMRRGELALLSLALVTCFCSVPGDQLDYLINSGEKVFSSKRITSNNSSHATKSIYWKMLIWLHHSALLNGTVHKTNPKFQKREKSKTSPSFFRPSTSQVQCLDHAAVSNCCGISSECIKKKFTGTENKTWCLVQTILEGECLTLTPATERFLFVPESQLFALALWEFRIWTLTQHGDFNLCLLSVCLVLWDAGTQERSWEAGHSFTLLALRFTLGRALGDKNPTFFKGLKCQIEQHLWKILRLTLHFNSPSI